MTIAALVGVALVHLVQLPDTFDQSTGLGVLFTILLAAAAITAAALVHTDQRPLSWAAALIATGAAGGYLLTRSLAVPFDRADVGNWLEPLGLVALYIEISLLGLSSYALRTGAQLPLTGKEPKRSINPLPGR